MKTARPTSFKPGHDSSRSNRVRQVRADTRQYLYELTAKEGREVVAEMLEHGIPAALGSLLVSRYLTWCRQVGYHLAEQWLMRARISPYATLSELTEDERWRLADVLRAVGQ